MTTLNDAKSENASKRIVIDVVRRGDELVVPEGMTLEQTDKVLHARMDYENQTVAINAIIDAPFVFEAAYALYAVLTEKYGWANNVATPGMFGPEPPALLPVPVGPGKFVNVPWGRFEIPNVKGYLESSATMKDGRVTFALTGEVKRVHEDTINEIVAAVRHHVQHKSIYRGQAFRVRLFADNGKPLPMPEPKFIDLDPATEAELVLPTLTDLSVRANIFAFIERSERVRHLGIPLKRGILLAGPFGTGKTMIASATANKAVRHGWTYIVCDRITELSAVVRLAREYGPAVLFCEDVDRIMRGDERSVGIDEVLNVIDGVESKGSELMIVLTTNELEEISTALLRPGRLDAVIHIGPPDAEAAERLVRQYGRGTIEPDTDLTQSIALLDGQIPAVIREAAEKSKLFGVAVEPLDTPFDAPLSVTDEALVGTIHSMKAHIDLLTPKEVDERSETVKAADLLAKAMLQRGAGDTTIPFPIRPAGVIAETNSSENYLADVPAAKPKSKSSELVDTAEAPAADA